jgi:hypothetical protein
MVTKRKQCLFEITGKDLIFFSCKVRKKRLVVQTKRYTKIARNRRPNFGECGVTARNQLANNRNPVAEHENHSYYLIIAKFSKSH